MTRLSLSASKPFQRAAYLAVPVLIIGALSANAQLTINAQFNTPSSDFAGSTPIANLADAATIESTINQALAQITPLISNNLTFNISFVSVNSGLGASVDTGHIDVPYSSYLASLNANSSKSSVQTTAIASLPAGPGTGINNNAANISIGGALLNAIGNTTEGNNLISSNGGLAGTVALNMSILNDSRSPYDTTKYDLVSTVTHEVNEILGIGGQGSTLTAGGGAADIGPMDLFRYSAGNRSYSNSDNISSYFSIDGGATKLVNFNQLSSGDYSDWGDGIVPADGSGNSPSQVQDAFGGTDDQADMGPNEAIALNAVGWNLTPAGLALESASLPEPGSLGLLTAAGLFLCRRRKP